MHYPANNFAIDPSKSTITTNIPEYQWTIGQREQPTVAARFRWRGRRNVAEGVFVMVARAADVGAGVYSDYHCALSGHDPYSALPSWPLHVLTTSGR